MSLKKQIKGRLKELQARYRRWRYRFTPDELRQHLKDQGLEKGDTLIVHSSYDPFIGFTGTPIDVVKILRELVGTDTDGGNLVFPTLPFPGTAIDYAKSGVVFDVRRSPSQMGLLSEVARRTKGAVRSLHPTHSVAVIGPDGADLTRDHEKCTTPMGIGSPFGKVIERNGKQLFLGAELDAMTMCHHLEALILDDMPFSPFTEEFYNFTIRDYDKVEHPIRTQLIHPHWSRRRDPHLLIPELQNLGYWDKRTIGMVNTVLLPAASTIEAGRNMAARGEFIYHDQGDPPGSSDPDWKPKV